MFCLRVGCNDYTKFFDSDVATFLFGMNLNKYIEHFSKEAIDLKTFLTLTDEDLCFIGVTDLEDRRTLLKGIINLKSHKNSNTVITDDIALSDKDVLVIASNALKQLSILHAAVAHTRLRLKATPVRNTIIDQHSVASLLTTLSLEGMLQNQILQTRLNGFENLESIKLNPTRYAVRRRVCWALFTVSTTFTIAVVLGLYYFRCTH
ncbi:uncharacterized protein LOC142328273 isoform X2 [Lycorma delicatula]|uniref:uncharacterized protein LOC142328273 isoform X2 n=1 Tax=Lycorma delicatula TaxID=130591 RepID=UPI003F517C61